MPSVRKQKTHDDHRASICLLCFTKIKSENRSREVGETEWDIIENYVVAGLDRTDTRLPTVLCTTCNFYLSQYSQGIFERQIKLFDFSSITGSPILTRDHTCTVCEIGLTNFFGRSKPKLGRPRNTECDVCPTPVTLCSFCFSTISPGKSHLCTQTTREKNIMTCIQNEKTGEKIASAILKKKLDETPDKENIDLAQKSGAPIHVKVVKNEKTKNKQC